MKLELASFPVTKISFSNRTAYDNGNIEVSKDELIALVLEDTRVKTVDFDIASPGEKTRIALVRDIVEPRVKVSGPGCVFPGIMGEVKTVGEGRTNRLVNMAVVTSAQYKPEITGGMNARNASVLDKFGPGAEISPLGKTLNLVLIIKLADPINEFDAHTAIQLAEFKVADRLARTTLEKSPEKVGTFELTKVDPSLPKIVYVLSSTTQAPYPHTSVAVYGMALDNSLPTLMHPNEIIDGAITKDCRQGSSAYTLTWHWQNLPVLFELLKNHGKTLNFLGVIMQRTRFNNEAGKRVTAEVTSQLAKMLGADGSINTLAVPSGNNFMDVMFTVESLEKKGIKTVLVTPDWGSNETDTPLCFGVPEAVSIVSSGPSIYRSLTVPPAEKVIGLAKGERMAFYPPEDEKNMVSPWDELVLNWPPLMTSGIDWFGFTKNSCSEH